MKKYVLNFGLNKVAKYHYDLGLPHIEVLLQVTHTDLAMPSTQKQPI